MHGDAPEPLLVRVHAGLSQPDSPEEHLREHPSTAAGATEDKAAGAGADRSGPGALTTAILALSLPILFAEVGENLIFVTDTAFLGRVGTTELAALAVADTAIELLAVPAIGLVEAMQIMVARRVGERRDAAVGQLFNRTLLAVVLVATVLAIVVVIAAPAASQTLTSSDDVATAVEDFLQIAAFALIPMAVNFAYSSLFVGLGRARVLIGATLVLAITNLCLSWLLVLGELGAPRLGMEGAAYAFLGAEGAALLYLTAHALRRPEFRRYGVLRTWGAGPAVIRPLVRLGSPLALQFLVDIGRWFVFFLILAQVSEHALAISSVVYACYLILAMPAYAFSEAVYSLVSNVLGRGQPERVGPLLRRALRLTYLVTAPLVLIAALFPDAVLSLLTSDADTVDGGVRTLQVAALALVAVVPAQLWLGALNGTGDADTAFLLELLWSAVMLGGTAVAALHFDLALEYIWLSVPAAALTVLGASYARLRHGRWRRRTA